ncbi:uncharacterized protein LOC127543253 isoform X1 [Antechinus flavipes]|uniref:uncharacterized protein LOC127543253 isoform X1 n=1 Tax=Antechinus flavipes TaxID=38775 RepID=UPI002236A0A7|nr:uncharacterized protein LOC127543253 isoform X1 [Antechinus flavipes]
MGVGPPLENGFSSIPGAPGLTLPSPSIRFLPESADMSRTHDIHSWGRPGPHSCTERAQKPRDPLSSWSIPREILPSLLPTSLAQLASGKAGYRSRRKDTHIGPQAQPGIRLGPETAGGTDPRGRMSERGNMGRREGNRAPSSPDTERVGPQRWHLSAFPPNYLHGRRYGKLPSQDPPFLATYSRGKNNPQRLSIFWKILFPKASQLSLPPPWPWSQQAGFTIRFYGL